MSQYIEVVLSCKHKLDFPINGVPLIGEDAYCRWCGRLKMVESAPNQYRVDCRDCTLARRVGADLTTAKITASKHVVKRNTHRVDIFNGNKKVATIAQDPNQGELPFDSVTKERLAANQPHQDSLKTIFKKGLDRTTAEPDKRVA